jgi:hypothetical protein
LVCWHEIVWTEEKGLRSKTTGLLSFFLLLHFTQYQAIETRNTLAQGGSWKLGLISLKDSHKTWKYYSNLRSPFCVKAVNKEILWLSLSGSHETCPVSGKKKSHTYKIRRIWTNRSSWVSPVSLLVLDHTFCSITYLYGCSFFIKLFFFIHMCIQGLGHFSPLPPPPPLSPLRPLLLPSTPSIPSRNYFALISNFVVKRV